MFIRKKADAAQPKLPRPPAYRCFTAKTYSDGKVCRQGRSLYEHCLITGLLAQRLSTLFSASGRKLFSQTAFWYAAAHDIGKLNPYFYSRVALNLGRSDDALMRQLLELLNIGLEVGRERETAENLKSCEGKCGFHPGIGAQAFAQACGGQDYQQVGEDLRRAADIIGSHHGWRQICDVPVQSPALGGAPWQSERAALLEELRREFNAEPEKITELQAKLWSGLTSISDWLASSRLFNDPSLDYHQLIDKVLALNNFKKPRLKGLLPFGSVFKDPQGRALEPNEMQQALAEVAGRSSCCVLQCPTGSGKTEAALYAALIKICAGKARGIYFALPTRLTASKVHQRLQSFLDAVLEPDSPFAKAFLLQGEASLMLTEAGAACAPGGEFFSSSRTKLLAPFAAGTIDQALLAVLPVKFYFVRLLGLADKVVIFDEVHSYDVYVSTLLRELIAKLQQAGAAVLILSATLTSAAVKKLLHLDDSAKLPAAYPALIYKEGEHAAVRPLKCAAQPVCKLVLSTDAERCLDDAVHLAASGQQVLWVENTVKEAQQIFLALKQRLTQLPVKVELGLLHSRFTLADRQLIEERWMSRLDKNGFAVRQQGGSILVGTQILEQSLDFDADALFTRLAPLDFLLQRIGRLWRFAGTPRPAGAERRCCVLVPKVQPDDEAALLLKKLGGSAYVYEPYTLMRTLEALQGLPSAKLQLPEMAQPLLEQVYAQREEQSPALSEFKRYVEEGCPQLHSRGRRALENLAVYELSHAQPAAYGESLTRCSTLPVVSCLLLTEIPQADHIKTKFSLLDTTEIVIYNDINKNRSADLRAYELSIRRNVVKVLPHIISSKKVNGGHSFNVLNNALFKRLCACSGNFGTFLTAAVVRGEEVLLLDENLQLCSSGSRYSSETGWLKE